MLTAALCLSKSHEVTLFWDVDQRSVIVNKAKHRFNLDLSSLRISPSVFRKEVNFFERLKTTKKYDALIYLSDGSIPLVACSLIIHFQSPMNWLNGKTLKNRLKLHLVKEIICNSSFTKSHIDTTLGVASKIVYPPVTIQGSFDPKKKKNVILNVGRFGINHAGSSYKKQNILADAFASMVKKGLKDWQLIFVMSVLEKDQDAVARFQKNYEGLPITYIINPDNDSLWDQYRQASIYWHAAGFGEDIALHPDRAEHFGISTVEAMGVGAVPIVFNAGGQKEIVQNNENGKLWNTPSELTLFTQELIHDTKTLMKLAENGVLAAKRFSRERFCSEIEGLIQ